MIRFSQNTIRPTRVALFLIFIGLYINIFSLGGIYNISNERILFKLIGTLILLFGFLILLVYSGINKKLTLYIFGISAFSLVFALREFINIFIAENNLFIISFIRFILITIIATTILSYNNRYDKFFHRILFITNLIIGSIGIIFIVFSVAPAESFFGIGIHSTRSIVFEQNVYGILMYLFFLQILFNKTGYENFNKKNKIIIIAISLIFILSSFYRTVYLAAILALIVSSWKKFSFYFLLFSLFIIIYSGYLPFFESVFKIEQLKNLTGRTFLWEIALDSFMENPIFGLGESMIPNIINNSGYFRPFGTFHNVIFDTMIFGGIIALSAYLFSIFSIFIKSGNSILFNLLVLLPALSNTYFPFAPNPIGLAVGVLILGKNSK